MSSGLAGAVVVLDRRTRLHSGAAGALLVGGQPVRVLRLAPPAAAAVQRWRSGAPVGAGAEQRLARRLHDLGVLVARPVVTPWSLSDITVVVPVRDRVAQLRRCLDSLPDCPVVVVDDGSVDAAAVASAAVRPGAVVLRREVSGGPAAARNTGLSAVRTPLVAFVDSDCALLPGALQALLPALLDGVAAVAPRIVGAGGRAVLARYERANGPLDLGRDAGPVHGGARVGYLPTAVLLCRVEAVQDGFDEALRWGEDVDLVWRLAGSGWQVRYEPQVVAHHQTREGLPAWCRQRHEYGRSAALLDARHPGRVAPAAVSRASLPAVLALAGRRPVLAAVVLARSGAQLAGKLPAGAGRASEVPRLLAAGMGWSVGSLLDAVARPWLPAALLACVVSPRARGVVLVAVVQRLVRTRSGSRCGLSPATWMALRVLDDLAYGTGVWRGALRHRRVRVLVPRVQ